VNTKALLVPTLMMGSMSTTPSSTASARGAIEDGEFAMSAFMIGWQKSFN
jgi:hypothetical protein